VDGSDHARAAAHLLSDLPRLPGSVVDVLAVLTARHTPRRSALLAVLDEARTHLPRGGVQVQTKLLLGHPAEVLTQVVQNIQPDLIVVGARGQRFNWRILLGGVAQQVVEHAACPVLVVRAPYAGMRRILLAIDNSWYSQRALGYLAQLPLPTGIEVHVVRVLPPLPEPASLIQVGWLNWVTPPLAAQELEQLAARQAETEERAGRRLLARTTAVL
jgi:nucleotide-binding universal stress UspA family protein